MTEKDKEMHDVNDAVIDCGEMFDIRVVSEMKEKFLEALDSTGTVTIDACEVDRVDTAGLQIFCAFINDAKAKGVDVQWKDPSQSLKDAAQLTGLTQSLNLQ